MESVRANKHSISNTKPTANIKAGLKTDSAKKVIISENKKTTLGLSQSSEQSSKSSDKNAGLNSDNKKKYGGVKNQTTRKSQKSGANQLVENSKTLGLESDNKSVTNKVTSKMPTKSDTKTAKSFKKQGTSTFKAKSNPKPGTSNSQTPSKQTTVKATKICDNQRSKCAPKNKPASKTKTSVKIQTVAENVQTTSYNKEIQIRPSEIRYSQSSISCKFSDDKTNIGSLVDDIWYGRCFVTRIPTIEVCFKDNQWVSADNRRLWVFKQLELLSKIETINVKVVKRIYQGKLTSDNAGQSVEIRGNICSTVLSEKFPEQFQKKKKRRQRRKNKPKKVEIDSPEIDHPILTKAEFAHLYASALTAKHSTICQEAPKREDPKRRPIVHNVPIVQIRSQADQKICADVEQSMSSSEYEYSEFDYSDTTDEYSRYGDSDFVQSDEDYEEYFTQQYEPADIHKCPAYQSYAPIASELNESDGADSDISYDDDSDASSVSVSDTKNVASLNKQVVYDQSSLAGDFSNILCHIPVDTEHSVSKNNSPKPITKTQSPLDELIATNISELSFSARRINTESKQAQRMELNYSKNNKSDYYDHEYPDTRSQRVSGYNSCYDQDVPSYPDEETDFLDFNSMSRRRQVHNIDSSDEFEQYSMLPTSQPTTDRIQASMNRSWYEDRCDMCYMPVSLCTCYTLPMSGGVPKPPITNRKTGAVQNRADKQAISLPSLLLDTVVDGIGSFIQRLFTN